MSEHEVENSQDRRILFGTFFVATIFVSIAIFVIAGISLGLPTRDPNHGHFGKSRLSLNAIESAINGLYTEYGKLPDVGNRVTTNSPAGLKLLTILLGLEEKSDNALNSRAIKFLSVKEGKNHKNGLIFSADGKSVDGLYDPWGSPYTVILDTEYKEHLRFTLGSKTIDLEGRRSAAFSPGPDGKPGTSDDVRTW